MKILIACEYSGIVAGFHIWWYSISFIFPGGGDAIYLVWLVVCCAGVPAIIIKPLERFLKP